MGLFSKKAQVPQPAQPVRQESSLTEIEYDDESETMPEPSKPIASKQQQKKQVQQLPEDVDEYDEAAEEPAETELAEVTQPESSDVQILAAIEQNFNDIFDRLVEINVRLEKLESTAFRGH